MNQLSPEVSNFLDQLNHPLRKEIESLRYVIVNSVHGLTENIKWNGPNYSYNGADRITMKIQPPKQIQLIFHRGAKKQEQPKEKIIENNSKLLVWKENDRAISTFKNGAEIESSQRELKDIISKWMAITR